MSLQILEAALCPPQERISAFIRGAAEFVGVKDYLNLRLRKGKGVENIEYKQIFTVADAITKYEKYVVRKKLPCYNLADKIERSLDPRVLWVRAQLTNVPLPLYLTARYEYLEAALDNTTRQRDEYKAAGIYVNERERAEYRLTYLSGELDLTKRVAVAAGIKIEAQM